MSRMPTREEAWKLVTEYVPSESLQRQALAVEAVMRHMARERGQDEELWGLTGLLHDVDFPHTKDTPEKHGLMAEELLAGLVTDEVMNAVKAHNSECTGVAPASRLDYALRCGETVTGMVTAAALVRPTGMDGMEAKSLKKKMKDKAFAAAVNRERIRECEQIGLSLDDFLTLAIKAMS